MADVPAHSNSNSTNTLRATTGSAAISSRAGSECVGAEGQENGDRGFASLNTPDSIKKIMFELKKKQQERTLGYPMHKKHRVEGDNS